MEKTVSSCVWTDEEVGVLLNLTLQYKRSKDEEDMDWEACKSKYADITAKFHEVLSLKQKSKDFPRTKGETTKAQLTAKLKSIRGKFRQAVNSGKRNGYGRTVLIYYELCDRIWGGGDVELMKGFPRTPVLDSGVETADFNGMVKVESPSPPASPGPCTEERVLEEVHVPASSCRSGSERASGAATEFSRTRRKPLRYQKASPLVKTSPLAKAPSPGKAPPPVNGVHRFAPLKRRSGPVDVAQEDLEIKRSMLELLQTQTQRADERMERLVSTMETLVNVITQSHAQLLGQCQCTCSQHHPHAGERNGSEQEETDSTIRVTNSYTLAVKKETESTEME